MKVIDYQVATGDSPSGLRASVHALMVDGWQPTGGVAVGVFFDAEPGYMKDHWTYFQAMVRYGGDDGE